MKYQTCPICGANLDHGEKCDCQSLRAQRDRKIDNMVQLSDQGQYKFNLNYGGNGMRITKLHIKNLFGISQYDSDGKSQELSGRNGVGKTSVIDAIRYALTNKSGRDYIVRKGASEGEIIIETDTGLTINRKSRTTQADYKSVKLNGREVGSPESFLKDIFTPLQLNPVEFISMDKKQQNALILDMIEYNWNLDTIREWFGELPSWVNYDQNILAVLNDIQSEKGDYFISRQDINRDMRNKRAFIEDIAKTIPTGYEAEKWRIASAGELYRKIESINRDNAQIERAKAVVENKSNKIRKFEADREIEISVIERETASRQQQIEKEIINLTNQIAALNTEADSLAEKKQNKIDLANEKYKSSVAEFEAQCAEYAEYAGKEPTDTTELNAEAKTIEDMKAHLNEYDRMIKLQLDVDNLAMQSESLTEKIEKARTLPGEILEQCTIPIKGLTVENGIPLINGLPVSNLSEGEKLDLCIDVAIQKPNGLQIILIDGVEKLATDLREQLYAKCKAKGLQMIATRTTDEPDLSIVEL